MWIMMNEELIGKRLTLGKHFESPPFGGRTKGFGGRNLPICHSKLEDFCPQKTLFRHVA